MLCENMAYFSYVTMCPIEETVCPANVTVHSYTEKQLTADILLIFLDATITHFFISFFCKLYNHYTRAASQESAREKQPIPETTAARTSDVQSRGNCWPKIRIFRSLSCDAIIIPSQSSNDGKPLTQADLVTISTQENQESNPQEPLQDYCDGGYFPLNYGYLLNYKYSVIRKLGYGHFSTVWLCQNKRDRKYVAVKVVKSSYQYTAAAKDEIAILQYTVDKNRDHFGYKRVLQMLDQFVTASPYGLHQCVVFELMGPSLLHLLIQSDYQGIKLPGIRTIVKQVLEGLVYLHNECNIVHTDLKPENILIRIHEPYIKKMVDTVKKFCELSMPMPKSYVSAEEYELRRLKPEDRQLDPNILDYEFDPLSLKRSTSYPSDEASDELISYSKRHIRHRRLEGPIWIDPNIEIKIADLGNACFDDAHYSSNIQTKQYRALEVIIGAKYSFPADIWSLGCMTFELATGEYLFNPKHFSDLGSEDDHIALIWELMDGIPEYVARSGDKFKYFFREDGQLRNIEPGKLRIWKLEDVLVEKYGWRRVEAIPFASFILTMIEPDPALRVAAATALDSQWLNMGDES